MTGQHLARRLSVSELVRVYQDAERKMREGVRLIASAEAELASTFTLDSSHRFYLLAGHSALRTTEQDIEAHAERWRRDAWGAIVERLELRRMMSITAWKELQEQIEKGECPPIDEPTVNAMVAQFSAALPEMLEQAVKEVFDWLRPCRTHYKSNSQLEVPRRVCMTWMLERGFRGPVINYRQEPNLTALENVFTALDGRGQITKQHYSEISLAIKTCKDWPAVGETPYFAFRGYKNGALHITFKRLDLLTRFNAIAGGKKLRPPETTP